MHFYRCHTLLAPRARLNPYTLNNEAVGGAVVSQLRMMLAGVLHDPLAYQQPTQSHEVTRFRGYLSLPTTYVVFYP